MAYRRRQQGLTSRFEEQSAADFEGDVFIDEDGRSSSSSSSSSPSLAAKAIRASSAYRDSSFSSAYSSSRPPTFPSPSTTLKDSKPHEYTSMKNLNEPKQGFWGVLARKAKAILDDDNPNQQSESPVISNSNKPMPSTTAGAEFQNAYKNKDSHRRADNPTLQKGLEAITSSINYIGGTIGTAVEEGLTIVENRTAGIIEGTRKHIRKKSSNSRAQNQEGKQSQMQNQGQTQMQTDLEIQLKASRDVAMAMAAKAKLLLRELKTVKADLAFSKQRCAQLEEENKILRESRDRGDHQEDDDLIRLQLETLLAEKARLAHENSIYARENRFLREVVEFHQLTMQDVVYLDEGTEEVTEVYPIKVSTVSNPHLIPTTSLSLSSSLPPEVSNDRGFLATPEASPHPLVFPEPAEVSQNSAKPSLYLPGMSAQDAKKHPDPSV